MPTTNQETIDRIREAVTQVTGRDLSGLSATDPLGLDSINRITLLVELENTFQKAIDSAEVTPESFETLDALARMVDALE